MLVLRRSFLAAVSATILGTGALPAAIAHEITVGDLKIDHPFARASAGPARNGAAYMTLHNTGDADDTLVAAAADVSERIELHEHIMDDGVMRMREVDGGIAVPAGGTAVLEPGGLHIMLLGLHAPLLEGESFPLTLTFERAGEVTVDVAVEAPGAMGHTGHDHGGGHSGHSH